MLEQGLVPTVFEKNNVAGGVWRNEGGNVWENMRTNLTRINVSFSNHVWSKDTDLFPTGAQVQEYLDNFIEKFNLKNYIKCKSNVIYVKQRADHCWCVTWSCDENINEKVFDFIVIANGAFSNPLIPEYDTKIFNGQIAHSMNYNCIKSNQKLKNKKVIVCGHSFSATEICADLVEQEANVLNVFRNPHWVVKKFIKLPEKSVDCPIDFGLMNRKGNEEEKIFANKKDLNINKNNFLHKICQPQNSRKELFINPNSSGPPFISISERYLEMVEQNRILIKKGRIEKFTNSGVYFDDGSYNDADIVLFSTGYRLDLNFLQKDVLDLIEFDSTDDLYPFISYKGTFHPLIKNLAFVGIKRSFYPMIEMQARWASLVFSERIKLPSTEIMSVSFNKEKELKKLPLRERNSRLDGLISLIDSIAEEINALPNFIKIKKENPRLYKILWEGPLSSVHYKLEDEDESINYVLNEIESRMNNL